MSPRRGHRLGSCRARREQSVLRRGVARCRRRAAAGVRPVRGTRSASCALADPAYELVRVAAVAGRRVSHDLLAAVSGQSAAELVALLREATAHHILIDDRDGRYAFRHALLQEAAYAELLPGERVTLHRRTPMRWPHIRNGPPRALERRPSLRITTPPRTTWLGCGVLCQGCWRRGVRPCRLRGARSVRAGSGAVGAGTRAGVPGALLPHTAAAALRRRRDARWAIGRAVELVGLGLQEVDGARDPQRAALLRWRLARLLCISGYAEGSVATHAAAVSTMPAEASAERAMILAAYAHVLMLSGQYRLSRGRCEEAIVVAQAACALREEATPSTRSGAVSAVSVTPGRGQAPGASAGDLRGRL